MIDKTDIQSALHMGQNVSNIRCSGITPAQKLRSTAFSNPTY